MLKSCTDCAPEFACYETGEGCRRQRRSYPQCASAYALLLPLLISVARKKGYALAVHGSMATDLDLIAVPWTEVAATPEDLVETMRAAIGGVIHDEREHDHNPAPKPHGRLAWSIYLQEGRGPYIDLSITPRDAESRWWDISELTARAWAMRKKLEARIAELESQFKAKQ